MNNLFTYLASRRNGPLDHLVNADILAAWGITPCVTPRCLEASFQFTHDHDDLQWLSHGACIVGMSLFRQTSLIQQQERIYAHCTSNNMCIHANQIRVYQFWSWKDFSSLRTFQDVLFKKGAGCKHTLRRQLILKNHISTSRDQIKYQGTALFPEFIN